MASETGQMKVNQFWSSLVAMTLVLPVTACGSEETSTSSRGRRSGEISSGQQEQITPGGIAAIVLDHLGRDTVRRVVTFTGEDEEGSVAVMVRLRDRTPHTFGVSVYPPEAAEELAVPGGCPPERDRWGGVSQCRVLENGTTVTTRRGRHGFSDDNRNGSFILSSVVTREDGAAIAMYESYDDTPRLSAAQLEDVVTDPRLTWLTDPALNKAGEAVELHELPG